MSTLRTLHLHGQLKEVCGGQSTVQLVGDTLPILISGLASMFGQEVKTIVKENNWQIYFDEENTGDGLHQDHVNTHLLDVSDLYLYPAVEGAGKVGNIIIGLIMIIVGVVLIWFSEGTVGWQQVAEGALLIAGGLMTIYTALSTPKSQQSRSPDENPSFIFNGAANVIEQGGAVPVVYGRFRTGSTVVSAGIDSEQMTAYTSPYSHNPAPDSKFDRYNDEVLV